VNIAKAYQALLRLYPRDHRNLFSSEMLRIFERACEERSSRGRPPYVTFVLREFCGLALGAFAEWAGELSTDPSRRAHRLPGLHACAEAPSEITDAQRRIDFCISRMEQAIATHDFQGARFYSNEDLKARERLRQLRAKYGIAE